MKPSETPTDPSLFPAAQPATGMSDEALLAAVNARGEESGRKSSLQTLLATGVLFLALGGLSWGWESVVYIALAVVLHELGHVFAMRHFGYKNVRMLFLPMFGGLATGEPRELDATKNAAVAIAGPVFGLASVLVAGVAAMWLESSSWLVEFAWVSLFLNAFNLLPLVPLDGGQFTNDVLFSRYPAMELGFRILAMAPWRGSRSRLRCGCWAFSFFRCWPPHPSPTAGRR